MTIRMYISWPCGWLSPTMIWGQFYVIGLLILFACRLQAQSLEIGLSWYGSPGNPDVDIELIEPSGEKIGYPKLTSASGGILTILNAAPTGYLGEQSEIVSWSNAPIGQFEIRGINFYGRQEAIVFLTYRIDGVMFFRQQLRIPAKAMAISDAVVIPYPLPALDERVDTPVKSGEKVALQWPQFPAGGGISQYYFNSNGLTFQPPWGSTESHGRWDGLNFVGTGYFSSLKASKIPFENMYLVITNEGLDRTYFCNANEEFKGRPPLVNGLDQRQLMTIGPTLQDELIMRILIKPTDNVITLDKIPYQTLLGRHSPILLVKDIVVPTDNGSNSATVLSSAIDNGSYDPEGQILHVSFIPAGPFPVGTNSVIVQATNSIGLSAQSTITITVEDRELPVIQAIPNIEIPTDSGVANARLSELVTPDALDNVGVVTLISGGKDKIPLGQSLITWTATDAAGNHGQTTQIVTVVDRELPVIIPPPSVVRWIGNDSTLSLTSAVLGTATATDNVGVTSTTSNAPVQFALGETRVIWTAQDAAGNKATAVQIVDVRSGSPKPEVRITSPGSDIVFAAGSTVSLTAEVSYANQGDVARVEFFIDGNLVGTDTTAPYGVTWVLALPGSHTVSALATCNQVAGVVLPAVINGKPRVFRVATPAQVQEVAP